MMMYKHKKFKKRPNEPNEPETKTLTFAAVLAKQLVDNNWDDGEHEATPAVMAPLPPRMSGNSEVWHGAQPAQASFQTNAGDVACALVKIEDEDNRREGDKRKGCHVCSSQIAMGMRVPSKRCLRAGHWSKMLRDPCREPPARVCGEYIEGSNSVGSQGTRRARGCT